MKLINQALDPLFSNANRPRETSIVFEFGAEKCCLKGGSLKRNQLVALPELPSETQQPKKKEEEEAKQDIESFAMDEGI